MGCKNEKELNVPSLLCFFETGNQSQADYCLKLRDNFKHERTVNYQIKSGEKTPFAIQFKIQKTVHNIQTDFDYSEEKMNQTLQKIYDLLNTIK